MSYYKDDIYIYGVVILLKEDGEWMMNIEVQCWYLFILTN